VSAVEAVPCTAARRVDRLAGRKKILERIRCPARLGRARGQVEMAMREEAGKLITTWRRDGCELGFGAGIAQGCATLGQIGFSERSGYTAVGGYATWPPGSVSRRRMGRS
jgi:hypothetical protein